MEIVIAVFVGAWIVIASVLAYKRIKREYGPYIDTEGGSEPERSTGGEEEVR